MADEIDLATDAIEKALSQALKRMRDAGNQAQGAKECMECGDEIPEGRQKLGFKLCVPCTEDEERRKSLYAE